MKLLLDTHVWLWMATAPSKLRPATRRLLVDPANELFLSAASAWEIAIKYHLGKLPLPAPPSQYLPQRLALSGVSPLAIDVAHALRAGELPMHHTDPFDRLLVAQSEIEAMSLVTADAAMAPYKISMIRA